MCVITLTQPAFNFNSNMVCANPGILQYIGYIFNYNFSDMYFKVFWTVQQGFSIGVLVKDK